MGRKGRRGNGEGNIGRTPDGRWYASRQLTLPDGREVRVKREAKTRALAVSKLQEACQRLLEGLSSGKVPTVREAAERWYTDTFCPGNPRPASKRNRRSLLERQIYPHLGDIRLDKLRTPRLRTWLADLGRAGYAPKTIANCRALLRQILDQAVEDGDIGHNPLTRRTRGPRVPPSGGESLTVEQARALLAAARGHRLEVALRLALGLGLRRGELCGLRWQDIDLSAATLTVAGQLSYEPGEGVQWVPTPKTDTGRRTLRLPQVLVGALRWHQERQRAERVAMGWKDSGYVLTSVANGGPLRPTSLYRVFKIIAAAAGLPDFTLHDLRHSNASYLLAEGVPVKNVSALLGHARASTTLDTYGHLLPGADDDASERVARLLEEPEPPEDEDAGEKSA